MLNSHRPEGENSYYHPLIDNFDYHMRRKYAYTVRFSKRFHLNEGSFKTHNFDRILTKLSKTNIYKYFGNRKWAELMLKTVNGDQNCCDDVT